MRPTPDQHGRLFSRKRFRDQSQAPNGYWRQLPNGRPRDLDSFDNPEEEEFFDVDMDDANPPLQADKVDAAKHMPSTTNDVDPTSTEVGLFVPYYKTLAKGDFDDE